VKGRIVMNAMAWWTDLGTWGATRAVTALSTDASDGEVGAALAELFEQSLTVPVDPGREATQVLLKAAGVRSHAALVKQARYVLARREENGTTVTLLPSAPGVEGGGWITCRPEEGITLETPSAVQLGEALREAISASQTTPKASTS
jgi:hypothetical protein